MLLVSSWDSNVRVYDVMKDSVEVTWSQSSPILDCCFGENSNSIFSGGLDMAVKMYDVTNKQEITLGKHTKPVKCVEYCKEERLVVTGSWDGTVKLWDLRSSSEVGTCTQPGKVFTMALTGKRVIVGTSTRQVWIWDLVRLAEPEQRRESSLKYQTRCIRAFVEGDGYALSSTEGRVAMEYFDPNPQIQAKKYAFKCHRLKSNNGLENVYPVNTLSFHPTFGTFASGGDDGIVNIWDGKNKKRLCQFRKYPNSIASCAFNYDGSLLAIASSYTFFEGEKENAPENIFIRHINELEVKPKSRQPLHTKPPL
uniref:Anaphase-promoting complex subunit 4 WD40 domain-containing protein n=1 Tax=Arcella intermedia TaxID=1963864 RepID=A0A6B2L9P5_9EUKA